MILFDVLSLVSWAVAARHASRALDHFRIF